MISLSTALETHERILFTPVNSSSAIERNSGVLIFKLTFLTDVLPDSLLLPFKLKSMLCWTFNSSLRVIFALFCEPKPKLEQAADASKFYLFCFYTIVASFLCLPSFLFAASQSWWLSA